MNILQLTGIALYTASLVKLLMKVHFGKHGETVSLIACLASGIILGSANAGLDARIAISLILFAAFVISAPFIQFKKKGEK